MSIKTTRANISGVWIIRFMMMIIICQILLLSESMMPFRFFIRSASFGLGLLFLAFFILKRSKTRPHPAQKLSFLILPTLAISFLNPERSSFLACFAHFGLYVAILSPLFWVPKLSINIKIFRKFILVIWIFHALSSIFGILQISYPGQFQSKAAIVKLEDDPRSAALRYQLPSGEEIFRPMGLTDTPGGAGGSGFYTLIFGFGLFLTSKRKLLKYLYLFSILLGLTCVAFSQVRITLVLSVIVFISLCIFFMGQANLKAFLKVLLAGLFIFGVGIGWAIKAGGPEVKARLVTLIEQKPTNVYYENRGHFLEETIKELIPRYPFGAGLGRWGMMSNYFPSNQGLWAEIQITGWLYDGGILLIIIYLVLLFTTLWTAFKIARSQGYANVKEISMWGALLLAYNMGAIASIFNFCLFIGQGGMEFWLFNAIVYAVYRKYRLQQYSVINQNNNRTP